MPSLIPEDPAFDTDSERQVWERLRDSLGDHDVLLANIRLTDQDKDHEADLVVLMPDFGVLVLEVKGGSVWVSTDRGRPTWHLKAAGSERVVTRSTRRETASTRCGGTWRATRGGGVAAGSTGRTAW